VTLSTLLKNPAKTSQGWLAGFGWSPSLVIVGLSGWFRWVLNTFFSW